MQSKAADVETYLAELPADRREAMDRIRGLCKQVLKGFEEGMDYGMPSFKKEGVVGVAFNSQKNYIALYINPDVVKANKPLLKGLSVGKSCIRYTKPEKIDFKVVKTLLLATVREANGQ